MRVFHKFLSRTSHQGILISFFFINSLYPQTPTFNPNSFIDSNFLEEEVPSTIPEASAVTSSQTESQWNSSLLFNLDLIALPRYNLINSQNLYDPLGEVYFPEFDNLFQIYNRIRYTFWQRRLTFNWNSSFYTLLKKKDSAKIAFASKKEYYLNEINLILNLGKVILGLGKINIREGTAFLANPTDFLLLHPNFEDISPFYPNRSIGGYQVQLSLILENWGWAVSYLPLFSKYGEFQRSYPDKNPYLGEIWSKLSWQRDTFQLKFLFYWNGYAQGGVNLNTTLGNEIVFFFDAAAKTISRPIFTENGEYRFSLPDDELVYPRYHLEEEYSYYGQGLLGITYTPASLFTLTGEIFVNIGKENHYWDKHRDRLGDLKTIALDLESNSVNDIAKIAMEYFGMMKEAMDHHTPLNFQPVFIGLGLSRDDAFSDFTSQIWNFSTYLFYSPFDTGFLWSNHIVWQAPQTVHLGLFTTWSFGKKDGVFTSLPRNFSLGLATQLYF